MPNVQYKGFIVIWVDGTAYILIYNVNTEHDWEDKVPTVVLFYDIALYYGEYWGCSFEQVPILRISP